MKNSLNDEKKSDKSEIVQINSPMTLLMYQSAIDIVVDRLKAINIELTNKSRHHVIRGITSRIKSPESITKKLIRKGKKIDYETAVESLNDIAGVRAVSYFFDDIYQISKAVKKQKDFTLIKEKDYVQKPKKSGYKSYTFNCKSSGCIGQSDNVCKSRNSNSYFCNGLLGRIR